MKKMLMVLAATFICGAIVFTSCSSDDDNEPKKAEFAKAVVKYTVSSDASTLGLFKVDVCGTDADGKSFVETMSNPLYTKTVEIPVSKLPCTVELYTVTTPLEDKIATEDFDYNVQRRLDVMSFRSDNTPMHDIDHENGGFYYDNPAGTSLSEFAKKRNNHQKIVVYIDANGNLVNKTNGEN